ncbi:MAG: transketolase C-terminal domain-containing protein [Patescibacteria group bacterium]
MTERLFSYKEAATEGLLQAMQKDNRVFLLGEGVDNITGVYGHVLPAFKQFGERRVIDTPLSENGLTGFAIGAALDGLRPVLIHQRNDFMLLTMDQMFNQAAKLRYASGGRHKIPLTVLSFIARKPGEGVQHSQSLQAIFAHFPGVKVGMPACPEDAKGMICAAVDDDDPVIILEHRSLFEQSGFTPEEYYKTPFRARVAQEGKDLTVVAVSAAVRDSIEAAKNLCEKGISAEIIDLRWLRPFDIETIFKSVSKTGRLLIVDTGWQMFGVGAEIIASVCERGATMTAPPKRISMADSPCPASQYLEKDYHPNVKDIEREAMALCSK